MNPLFRLTFATLAVCAALHAQADSIASSASSAGSASSGSVSDSIHTSSNSSSNSSNNNKVGDRDYHVVDIAQAPHKPGLARVTIQADDADWRVMVDLPQAIVDQQHLRNGDAVHAQQRVYGIEFERGATRDAFFLALNDDWVDELAARKVNL